MVGIIHYETFLITGILLNLTPGNDTIFIVGRSLAQGKTAGILSALGIGTGSLIHTTLAAFGLSVILGKSLLLFNIIKYAGAAYLVYLGIKMLRDKSTLNFNLVDAPSKVNFKTVYRDAIITNVLNPKVALFFIAFLPQFIDPLSGNTVLPFILLGLSFTTTGTIWCLLPARFSALFFSRVKNNQKAISFLNKSCGIVLIGLGVKVALANRK